ncbi:MAG TPA: carboxypeptidase regulatory-like domain-containing protein, partial [Candidatus Sumerlaeota bacterium]|nr:carboxypeptidase regulatory-like domain-containing protein [Candidatus Sumerlaeota bacterium]
MRCNALRHAIRRGLTRGWITSMLLALALGFTPGPDLSAHDDDRAEIRGHVTDAVTGKPIEGANVFAVRDKSNSSLQRKTDGKGKYEFKHLEPGPWVIEVGKPGYAPQRAEVVLQPDKRLELDFALQPNMDDVGEIAGAVIDNETGEPVPDAFVFVRDPLKDGPHDVIGDSTDEHGRYSIPGLPAGRYEVHAVHPDYERAKKTVEVHAGLLSVLNFDLTPRQEPGTGSLLVRVADADTGLPVAEAIVTIEGIFTFAPLLTDENGELAFDSLAAGERRVQVDKQGYEHQQQIARIEAGRQTLLEFELVPLTGSRLGAIAGRVINGANEAPIEHARVYYRLIEHDDDDDDKSHDASPDGPFVETGPDGVYEIPDLRPGLYGLKVVAEGFYSQWNKAEVKPGETTRVPFALRLIVPAEAGFLAGQVTDAATSEPVVGARVFFARQDEVDKTMMLDATDESRPHVVTDENGNYETPPLRPGQYLLVVRARGYEPARRMAEVRSGETTEVNFSLVPFVPVEPGSITGLVLDGLTSQPIAGALIFFAPVVPDAPDGSVAPHDDLADHLPSVRTDNTGRYQIDDLRPGRYRLIARARGYLPATARAEVQSGQSTRVNFALRPDPNPDAGVIQGRVIDRESNLPLAGAFVFFARLPINTVEPPAALNEFGAMMSIEPPAGGDDYVRTNGRGRYQTPRLRPGVYVVIAWAPGFASQHVIVPLPVGGAAEANFALQPLEPMHPGVIEGRVIDRLTGDPVAGAWVFYHPAVDDKAIAPHDAPDAAHPRVRTNARGEFWISPLRPGRYHLAVRADGFEPAHKNVNVEAGEVTAVRFLLEPKRPPHPGAIVGQVVDGETGDPVPGARVFFGRPLDDDDTVEWWRKHDAATDHLNFVETDDQGFYRIKPLRPGAWHLLVRAAGYQPAARKVVVRPGQTVEANFKLRPNDPRDPGSIVGRVTDGTSQTPLEGARVYYRPIPRDTVELDERSPDSRFHPSVIVDSERPPFVETDANGRFKIEHLRPGRYQLLAVAAGYLPASEIVAVEQGHTTEASFALRPRPAGQGDLAGIVVDAQTHDPLRGAHVWVIPAGNVVIAEAMIPAVILGEAITDNTG